VHPEDWAKYDRFPGLFFHFQKDEGPASVTEEKKQCHPKEQCRLQELQGNGAAWDSWQELEPLA
jgi:hypothetical protein